MPDVWVSIRVKIIPSAVRGAFPWLADDICISPASPVADVLAVMAETVGIRDGDVTSHVDIDCGRSSVCVDGVG